MYSQLTDCVDGYWIAPGFDTNLIKQIFLGSSTLSYEGVKEKIKKQFNLEHLLDLTQVHGDKIVKALQSDSILEADGFFVEEFKPLGMIIKTADCLPIIIRSAKKAAIVHAGWRGLAAGIVEKAVKLVLEDNELFAAIGPCICKECFEVDRDVFDALGGEKRGSKYYPDLAEIASSKILQLAPQARVIKSEICTKCGAGFNSYRRDKKNAGRNIALLVISSDNS